jgi:hypothetical protein
MLFFGLFVPESLANPIFSEKHDYSPQSAVRPVDERGVLLRRHNLGDGGPSGRRRGEERVQRHAETGSKAPYGYSTSGSVCRSVATHGWHRRRTCDENSDCRSGESSDPAYGGASAVRSGRHHADRPRATDR